MRVCTCSSAKECRKGWRRASAFTRQTFSPQRRFLLSFSQGLNLAKESRVTPRVHSYYPDSLSQARASKLVKMLLHDCPPPPVPPRQPRIFSAPNPLVFCPVLVPPVLPSRSLPRNRPGSAKRFGIGRGEKIVGIAGNIRDCSDTRYFG